MSIIYNGTTLGALTYNGTNLDKVVYNGTTVHESGYTISWAAPLCTQGTSTSVASTVVYYNNYMGTASATTATLASDYPRGRQGLYGYNKRIKYTDTSGQIAYANPYSAGSIKIKKGTSIYFEMFSYLSKTSASEVAVVKITSTGSSSTQTVLSTDKNTIVKGSTVSCSDPKRLLSTGYTPTQNCSFEKYMDRIYYTTGSNAQDYGQWRIKLL